MNEHLKTQKYQQADIEILVSELTILNQARLVPPFTIEDETDGGEDIKNEISLLRYKKKSSK